MVGVVADVIAAVELEQLDDGIVALAVGAPDLDVAGAHLLEQGLLVRPPLRLEPVLDAAVLEKLVRQARVVPVVFDEQNLHRPTDHFSWHGSVSCEARPTGLCGRMTLPVDSVTIANPSPICH